MWDLTFFLVVKSQNFSYLFLKWLKAISHNINNSKIQSHFYINLIFWIVSKLKKIGHLTVSLRVKQVSDLYYFYHRLRIPYQPLRSHLLRFVARHSASIHSRWTRVFYCHIPIMYKIHLIPQTFLSRVTLRALDARERKNYLSNLVYFERGNSRIRTQIV